MELCLDHAILTNDYHKANQYINQQLTHLNQYQPIIITARPKQKLLVYSNRFHGDIFFSSVLGVFSGHLNKEGSAVKGDIFHGGHLFFRLDE